VVKNDDQVNDNIRFFLREIQKKYSNVQAYIYGSYAKGTSHKWSDIDLAIISPDFAEDTLEDRLCLMRIAASIDDRIEPHPFKKHLFNLNDPLAAEIQKNGIRIL
jgi:predicted nucleotidyltransferase